MHLKNTTYCVTLLLSFMSMATRLPAQTSTEFFLHDGDTPMVFVGDSITEQRMYTALIEAYTLSRFPTWKITFRNSGWSGDKATLQLRGPDFNASLQRDILSLQPKAATIDYGMNDANEGDAGLAKYTEYETKLVEALKKAGTRVALLTSTPREGYETGLPAGNKSNPMLQKYADALKDVATKENVLFIDQYTPFVKTIEDGRVAGVLSPNASVQPVMRLISPDGVHPELGGHFLMATIILRGMKAPALVSSASLDATAKSTSSAQGCTIEWQDAPAGSVQFKRTDNCLPWPVPNDSRIDLVMKIPGFDPATWLNQYELKVANLTEASYTLSIDDKEIGTYAAADLAKGVNLGFMRKGPIFDQGQKLYQAIVAKNEVYYTRWRGVQIARLDGWIAKVPGIEDARTAELARMDKIIADDEAKIDELRKPVPHVFKLTPVPK